MIADLVWNLFLVALYGAWYGWHMTWAGLVLLTIIWLASIIRLIASQAKDITKGWNRLEVEGRYRSLNNFERLRHVVISVALAVAGSPITATVNLVCFLMCDAQYRKHLKRRLQRHPYRDAS